MSGSPLGGKAIWLLPIVVFVCALMVLPAGAMLGRDNVNSSPNHVAGTTQSGLSTASASRGSSGPNPVSNPLSPASVASTIAQQSHAGSSFAPTTLSDFSGALSQLASKPSLSSHAALLNSLAQSVASGKASPGSIYLPNLGLLANPISSPGQVVTPGYVGQPAPMGLGDFGLGASGPYVYNTSSFAGSLVLNSSQATFPGAYYFVTPPENTLSSYADPYRYGIQLNTVVSNISIPGSETGAFWTQNVVTWDSYTNTLEFEDNVWNFSSSSGLLEPGTIDSGNGTFVAPSYYYDYGPAYTLTPPITLNLYNNASVRGDRSTVTFGFAVRDSAAHSYSGVYDTVIFSSPGASLTHPVPPAYAPAFEVNGRSATPLGLLWDAELIFGGPGGGSNAVFSDLNGSMTLDYKHGATYTSIPSAYDFGADTGETAVGIAGWWTGTTEFINQGPSMLYGLWNAVAHVSVASGNVRVSSAGLSPDYLFVFIGNTLANLSYEPTNINGGWQTYLPRAIPPATGYVLQAFADGFDEANASWTGGAVVTGALSPDYGVNRAPLYIDGGTQASNAEGYVGNVFGYFDNLQLDVNISFNHLNDWGYQSFNLIQATGVDGLTISNVTQGPDSGSQTIYVYDIPAHGATPTLLNTSGVETKSIPGYSGTIALFESFFDSVSYENFTGYNSSTVLTPPPTAYGPLYLGGGALLMWFSDYPTVWNITATGGSYGVYLANSWYDTVYNITASGGSNGVSMYGVDYADISNVAVTGKFSFGVYGDYAEYLDVYNVNASDLAYGVFGAWADYVNVYGVNATTGATGVFITYGSEGILPPEISGAFYVQWVNATAGATGIVSQYSGDNQFVDVTAVGAVGVNIYLDGDYTYPLGDSIYNLVIDDTSAETGSYISYSWDTLIQNPSVNGAGVGLSLYAMNYTEFDYVWDNAASTEAVSLVGSNYTDLYYLTVNASGKLGVSLTDDNYFYGEYATTAGPTTYSVTGGTEIQLEYGSEAIVNGVTASGSGNYGIYLEYFAFATVTGASASDAAATAVWLYDATQVTITDTTATSAARAVVIDDSSWITVSGTSVSGFSQGVYIYGESHNVQVTSTTATGESIGVVVYESGKVSITGVTASNTTLSSPWNTDFWWGWPAAAVVTEYSYQVTVSNVVATNYPIALYDYASGDGEYGAGSIYAQNINATGGWYAVMLNNTYYGYFNDIGAYQDYQGATLFDAYSNDILGSSFVDDTSYGVSISYGEYNWVWGSNFIGDNGATSTYSVAHIQAYSGYASGVNYFDNPVAPYGGNYWSDWHTYSSNGALAPYYVGDQTWDYAPLSLNAQLTAVWFYESGLPSGTSWSATFNGATQSTVNSWLVFGAPSGTFAFSAGNVTGYTVMPASGNVTTTTGSAEVNLAYTAIPPTPATYTVTLTETGLPAGTSWTAIFGGNSTTTTAPKVSFNVTNGTYAYQVPQVAGYTVSPSSGSVTVAGTPYSVAVAFTVVKYAVTVTESGLSSGASWSATVNGNTQTSTGTSILFSLPNGTYTISVANVNGYSLANGTIPMTVNGAPTGVSASFTPSTSPSYVSTDTFNSWLAVAIALAVIALVLVVLALFLSRRREPSAATGAQPWTAPPPEGAPAEGAATPPAAGSSSWSEGPPPAGGSPPS